MDESRFDAITKTLGMAGSRRVALQTLVERAGAIGLGRLGLEEVDAKKKRKKKRKKKLKRNSFGCVNVGGKCQGKSANCCSGICEGKKPKKGKKDKSQCVAHNELDCEAGANTCLGAVPCGINGDGLCYQTTGRASFCGVNGVCFACQKDVDCAALGFGSGAACVVCIGCPATGNTACVTAAD